VRFNGLLLKKQWWDVLADATPTALLCNCTHLSDFAARFRAQGKTQSSTFYSNQSYWS
jgi:hypothetical protein